MKRPILSQLLLCLTGITLCAQQPQKEWELSSTENGTKEYIARDHISLKPGFTYKAVGSNTFTAKIDEYLVFPPKDSTYILPDQSITKDPLAGAVVGAIPSGLSVNQGNAIYNIPIDVPTGINGLQPSISLDYNSNGRFGSAGYKFNLNGISVINRTAHNLHYDNNYHPISFDGNDRFVLDGSRLMLLEGSYGANNATYAFEVEDYSRINSYGNIGDGPEWFQLETKEGLKYEYGRANDSRLVLQNTNGVLSWFLSKINDQYGNYIKYHYEKATDGNIWISSIEYGGNQNTDSNPSYLIEFDYYSNSELNISYNLMPTYIAGSKITFGKFLKQITIKSNSQLISTYDLTYENTYLKRVIRKNADGEKLPPVEFSWDNSFPANSSTIELIGGKSIITGDFTGDGKDEIAKLSNDGKSLIVEKLHNNQWYQLKSIALEGNLLHTKITNLGDINGDGVDDILGERLNRVGITPKAQWSIINGKNLAKLTNYITGELIGLPLTGVFLADGKKSVILINKILSSNKKAYLLKDGILQLLSFSDGLSLASIENCGAGDFNGDGRSDIMIKTSDQIKFYSISGLTLNHKNTVSKSLSEFYIQDFNSDGIDDLLVTDNNTIYYLQNYRLTGDTGGVPAPGSIPIFPGIEQFQYVSNIFKSISNVFMINNMLSTAQANSFQFIFRGISSDKSKSIFLNWVENVISNPPPPAVAWDHELTYNPDVMGGTYTLTILPRDYIFYHWEKTYTGNWQKSGSILGKKIEGLKGFIVADFTGTGQKSTYMQYSDELKYLSSSKHNKSVTKISQDYNNTISIKYATLTVQAPLYVTDRDATYPIIDLVGNYMIVKSVEKVGVSRLTYQYSGAKADQVGKGFLGFRKIIQHDEITGERLTEENQFYSNMKMFLPKTLKISQTYDFLKRTESEFDYNITLNNRRIFYHLNSINQIVTPGLGTGHKKHYSNYDNFGNPKTITTDYGGGWKETQKLTYINKGSWCDNKISTLETTYENTDEDPITLKKGYNYNDKGKLIKESVNLGTPDAVFTEYLNYDSFGNPRKIKVTTAKGDLREVEMSYQEGRFLHTEKNIQLNETTTYNYDLTKGFVKSKTDPLGTTSYKYDGFGRLTEVTYPNKIKTAISRQWSGDASLDGPKYYVYEETSGQSPVKTWYDALGREVRKDYNGLNDLLSVTTTYDDKGRLYQISEPFIGSSPSSWAVTHGYDDYGRNKTITTPAGITSYTYNGLKTTVSSPTGNSETTLNSAGKVIESKVNEKKVTYEYYPTGQISKAIPEGSPAIEFEYDLLGNRTALKDPDAGTIKSEYNGFGQILKNTHKIHTGQGDSITSYKYFASGLIDEVSVHGEITKYKYDSKNRIEKIGIAGVHEQSFMYDSNNQPIKITEKIDGSKTYVFETDYDAYGRIKKEVYPSGFYVSNEYDENGFLISVTDSKDQKIWEAVEANVKGQLTKYKQGGYETVVDYHDIWGLPNSIVSGNRINMAYYYTEKGNLDYREDRSTSGKIQKEKFYYDAANRLENYDLSLNGILKQSNTILYDPLTGGIQNKSDVGFKMEYGQNAPFHALSGVQGIPESAKAPQAITYSNINKVKSITQGNKVHQITYGVDQQRIKGIFKTGSTTTLTKYYLGNYEEEVVSGSTRKLHYIYGGNGLAAIMEYKNGQENLFYTFTDYQGNLLAVTNTAGTERYAYDPWGARRNPEDWTQPDTRSSLLFSRGYTMHEHLDDFGIINMNGRVYDPLMAQFFSPDPHIQSPGNWYNYNRYAYCLNNPLIYSDPTGEKWKWSYLNPVYWLGEGMQWINDNTIGLRQKMTEIGVPDFNVGYNSSQGSFHSIGDNGNFYHRNQFDPGVNVIRSLNELGIRESFNSDYFSQFDRNMTASISHRINRGLQPVSNNGFRSFIDHSQDLGSAFSVYSDFSNSYTLAAKRFNQGTTIVSIADHVINENYGNAISDLVMQTASSRFTYPIMMFNIAYSGVMETEYGTGRMSIYASLNWHTRIRINEQNPTNWNLYQMERAERHMVRMRRQYQKYRK